MTRHNDNTSQKKFFLNTLSKQIKKASFSFLVCGSLVSASAIAQSDEQNEPAARAPAEQAIAFDISAQLMASALGEFTRQSRVKVVLSESASMAGLTSVAVDGTLAPQQALEALLKGTGLVAQQVSSGDFVVSMNDIERPPKRME